MLLCCCPAHVRITSTSKQNLLKFIGEEGLERDCERYRFKFFRWRCQILESARHRDWVASSTHAYTCWHCENGKRSSQQLSKACTSVRFQLWTAHRLELHYRDPPDISHQSSWVGPSNTLRRWSDWNPRLVELVVELQDCWPVINGG